MCAKDYTFESDVIIGSVVDVTLDPSGQWLVCRTEPSGMPKLVRIPANAVQVWVIDAASSTDARKVPGR